MQNNNAQQCLRQVWRGDVIDLARIPQHQPRNNGKYHRDPKHTGQKRQQVLDANLVFYRAAHPNRHHRGKDKRWQSRQEGNMHTSRRDWGEVKDHPGLRHDGVPPRHGRAGEHETAKRDGHNDKDNNHVGHCRRNEHAANAPGFGQRRGGTARLGLGAGLASDALRRSRRLA